MKVKILFFALFIIGTLKITGSNMDGDSVRYKQQLFEVDTIKDVVYARVNGYWDSYPDDSLDVKQLKKFVFAKHEMKELDLKMDIYLPKGDTMKYRPLIVLAHGGGFYIGDKTGYPYRKWCSYFASLGYVCVSINYRMGMTVATRYNIERCEYRAMQDAHSAIRYLVANAEEYGIDISNVFAGGSSAGSIMMLAVGYMRNDDRMKNTYRKADCGDFESSGNDYKVDFTLKGLINMWGAVYDTSYLNNANIPIVSFHGDEDNLVPYCKGRVMQNVPILNLAHRKMCGSAAINDKAQSLGIKSVLYTYAGWGHALHADKNHKLNDNFYDIQYKIRDFLYDLMMNQGNGLTHP